MAVSAFTLDERTQLVRALLDAGVHVQLSSGLSRIDHHRLRAAPLARESLYYVEPRTPSRWEAAAKRGIDLVVGAAVVVATAPLLVAAAVAVKLESPGPIFYRQRRVGRNGELFTVWKVRTMVVDAEARLADLQARNQMVDGPLFKLDNDPRITRVGRFLRATSIDELPQLLSVLRGEMSLVGPRPALPDEVERFDAELRRRQSLRPGITGLWQIEARDNTSFGAYRRLDLFYLDNRSLRLDLAILGATLEEVIARALVSLRKRRSAPAVSVEVSAS
jgi:lipopolysaccharide/colanic/teichoic acid biosynthesis glycosyltransferase